MENAPASYAFEGLVMAGEFDPERFLEAQRGTYPEALREMEAGRKRSHWMWFIFPQIDGLGSSAMARRYAIQGRAEAVAFLRHPVLGARLREITAAVNRTTGTPLEEVFGYPDDLKFHSSMTLFAEAAEAAGSANAEDAVFAEALERWFGGRKDAATLQRLR